MINNSNFIHEIEKLSPYSREYLPYWSSIKRKMFEGEWVAGKWMPGPIWFYVNIWKIELSESKYSSNKIVARPFLRDIEWEKGYIYEEARGFSGFADDEEYTCYTGIIDETVPTSQYPPDVYNSKGELKKYTPVREYVRKIHSKNLGKPLYKNSCKNIIDIECRNIGKSFLAAGIMAHEFLTDGCRDYDEYLSKLGSENRFKTNIVVGAIEEKYSGKLLEKFELGYQEMAGSFEDINGDVIPSPISKSFTGSFNSGPRKIIARAKVKKGNKWIYKGSRSTMYHVTFKDKPHAGNAARSSLAFIDEVGFMNNFIDVLGKMKDVTYNDERKYGVIWGCGTGGEMESGATEQAKQVFYNPEEYDCLSFEDTYEHTGKIGLFIPYHYSFNDYRDENGNLDYNSVDKIITKKREKLKASKDKQPYYDEIQNNPVYPSEAFYKREDKKFPVVELKEQLQYVQTEIKRNNLDIKGTYGDFLLKDRMQVEFVPDLKGLKEPVPFPLKKGEQTEGTVIIWEHPTYVDGKIPYGLYLAGTDPYDQDKAENTTSCGSTFIWKTYHPKAGGTAEMIVAEFTGRPTAKQHHETVRRLLLYYNAVDLYENNRNSLKHHFEVKHSLHLLLKSPNHLSASANTSVDRRYGLTMTAGVKEELITYYADHLLEQAPNGKLNYQNIYSEYLLKELVEYNDDGNFDRGMAVLMMYANVMYHQKVLNSRAKEEKKREMDPFFKRYFEGEMPLFNG